MVDALKNIRFKDGGGEGGLFIKFVADQPVKLRVFTTNPIVANDPFGNTRYNFAVWNFTEAKAMILSAGAVITRAISELHSDEDYGADITAVDIKISPTGEKMERRYSVQVLPKITTIEDKDSETVVDLDRDLEKFVKNGIRAEDYNNGGELPGVVDEVNAQLDAEALENMPPDFLQ